MCPNKGILLKSHLIEFYQICTNICFDLFVMGSKLTSKKIVLFKSSSQISDQKIVCYKFKVLHRDTPINRGCKKYN